MNAEMLRRYSAEFVGTCAYVSFGCGALLEKGRMDVPSSKHWRSGRRQEALHFKEDQGGLRCNNELDVYAGELLVF
jgi:hypothetical protein